MKSSHTERQREWRRANPDAYRAHNLVKAAKKTGRLTVQPCEECGLVVKRMHAHHDDYSAPLTVRWFCPKHHHSVAHASREVLTNESTRVNTHGRVPVREDMRIFEHSDETPNLELLRIAMSRLPDYDRNLIVQKYFEGMKLREIAAPLGVCRERARQLLQEAEANLRAECVRLSSREQAA